MHYSSSTMKNVVQLISADSSNTKNVKSLSDAVAPVELDESIP